MKSQISKTVAAVGLALALGASLSPALAASFGAERFSAIHAGLTQDEVRNLVGTPGSVMDNTREGATIWIYEFTDTWGYRSEFDVEFNGTGVVTEAFAERLGG
jgi:hypothetical protein